jgi:hypothetical protein
LNNYKYIWIALTAAVAHDTKRCMLLCSDSGVHSTPRAVHELHPISPPRDCICT